MKIKKIISVILLTLIVCLLTGCVNLTCSLNLKENGKMDVNVSVLYSDKEFSYDNEAIDNIKNELIYKDFIVEDINENGMKGFSFSKENIRPEGLDEILENEYNIDISDEILDSFDYERGFLYNKYDLDTDIDLTSFAKLGSLTDGNGQAISGEELQKIFSHLSLKLIVNMDSGFITETNSKLLSNDKKTAEWVLIPGTKSEVEFEAITTNMLSIVGTIVILATVLLITVVVLIVLIKMYIKRKKECNKE
ncbi:MAG: DUF3153 domain-containing protein [Ruminococcaceae bacterium]|nr:DUF3153 domain-containing protein [Oscillospiraceae bacterium]